MVITQEQAEKIKDQLLQNLPSFPADQRDLIKEKVLSLSPPELEEFLKKNNLIQQQDKCIFCSISQGKIPSVKIDENKENIAILEINPLSKGHTLIVPKTHSDKLPDSSEEFTNKIIQIIKQKLNPKEIKLQQNNITGHQLIEIIPVYNSELKREKTTKEELEKLQKILIQPPEQKKPEQIKVQKQKQKKIPKLPQRIP